MTDLTQRPPRSPRVRLGGFVLLPRMLDKCRAEIEGKAGDYKFNCPLDQRFFSLLQLDAQAFKAEVQAGKGDGEMLRWVMQSAGRKLADHEIFAWSAYQEARVPTDLETREFFHGLHRAAGPAREDIGSWFDLLDLDDYVSFGGRT
jgi:hypothetical protein